MRKTLSIFSYIFHPLFIPVMVTLFYFYFGTNYHLFKEIYIVIAQVVILTLIVPLLIFYLLYTLKRVDSIMIADINQRKIPLLIHFFLLFYLIKKVIRIEYFYELYFSFLASLFSMLLAFMFLFLKQKASLHMLGISSFLTFVILLSLHTQSNFTIWTILLVLVCGCVASSRLALKAHTHKELVLGTLIGITPQLTLAYFWV